jgi:tetratricopeptide (TPR) repeat protein
MRQSILGFLVSFAALLFLVGCGQNPVRARLAEIDSFAASNPDSARRALEAIDHSFLNTRRLQAQHALMLSTALSRCKVKVPSDSLINIAVNYFGTVGPRKDAFLSYYYQGRVYQDLEDYESAMRSYLVAESIHSKKISPQYLTSLYLMKGEIYQHYYDYEKAVEAYQKAQKYARQCNWQANYMNALTGELAQYVIFQKNADADSMIRLLSPFRDEMNIRSRMAFDNTVLVFSVNNLSSQESLLDSVQAFERRYSSLEGFPWASLSLFYTRTGAFSDAERSLEYAEQSIKEPRTDAHFLQSYSELNDSLGRQVESQKARGDFQQIIGQRVYEKGASDLRFLEERRVSETRSKKQYLCIEIGALAIILFGGMSIFWLRKRRKQKEFISQQYSALQEEYEGISALVQSNASLQEEARAVLGERVKSLAKFLSVESPSSLNKVANQLESLVENRKQLLETIGLLYAVYHPAFVNRLHDYGLTNGEIGYCCLLILGFRTGEIGDVINRSSTYHISSVIRQKVGLGPNDTNLSIFLKKLFQETGS